MLWRGYNASIDDTKLDPGESGDESNAFHFGGKMTLLGPRKGTSSFNTTAYGSNLRSAFPFHIGNLRYIIYTTTNGGATQVAAPLAAYNAPDYGYNTSAAAVASFPALKATTTLAGGATEVTSSFNEGTLTFNTPANGYLAFNFPNVLTITSTASGAVLNGVNLAIHYGLVIGGVNTYAAGPSFYVEEIAGSPANRSRTITLPGGWLYGYWSASAATGACMRITFDYSEANVTSASATVSGTSQVWAI